MALEEDSVLDVACLSQRYLVTELQEQCAAHCRDHASPANAVTWLVLADTCKLSDLRADLIRYVAGNRAEIEAASPDAQDILAAHPRLIYALFTARDSLPSAPPAKRVKTGNTQTRTRTHVHTAQVFYFCC